MVFTLLFPDFYPECRAILPGFRPDSGVVCLADALCDRQPQPSSAAVLGIIQPICSGIYHIGRVVLFPHDLPQRIGQAGFVRYNQDIHRQISFGFLQFIDTVYHN